MVNNMGNNMGNNNNNVSSNSVGVGKLYSNANPHSNNNVSMGGGTSTNNLGGNKIDLNFRN